MILISTKCCGDFDVALHPYSYLWGILINNEKMKENPFQLEDLKRAQVESTIGKSIIDFTLDALVQGYNSLTGPVTLHHSDDTSSTIFFKKSALTVDRGDSYRRREHLEGLHLREGMYLNIIYDQINKDLVPRLLGRITEKDNILLFIQFLEGASAQQDYAQLMAEYKSANTNQDKDVIIQRKLDFLRRDLQQIAKFNGACHVHQNHFPRQIRKFLQDVYQNQQGNHSKRLEHYLKRSVHYWQFDGKEGETFNSDEACQRIKLEKGVDLERELFDIKQFREKIKSTIKLQHGDCRVQHNFKGVFSDLEDFGYYPMQHDIVTYMSNDAAAPPVSQLPSLLAYYFLLEKAYSSKSSTITIEEINDIDSGNPDELNRLIKKKVRHKNNFPDFVVGYLAQMLEEDIVIDGVNKKYAPKQVEEILKTVPGLTQDGFQRSKMKHIDNLYHFMTSIEAGDLFGKPTHREAVMAYFYHVGKLLTDLELVDIGGLGYLEKLSRSSRGSQYSLFFGDEKTREKIRKSA